MKQKQRDWLTTGQAALLCAVTPATVLSWIRKGRLEGIRTAGGHYRIRRQVLEPLLVDDGTSTAADHQVEGAAASPLRCWEYLSDGKILRNDCKGCVAYRTRASWCFLLAKKESGDTRIGHTCPNSCGECAYYRRVVGKPTRVLVVSSDQNLIGSLQQESVTTNLALSFAHTVYEASAAAQSFPPAFAVIDGEDFPPQDGGLVESLSLDPRLPGLKIIVATPGGADRKPAYERKKHVAVNVIERPFGLDQITAVIESYPVESVGLEELAKTGLSPEGESAMVEQMQVTTKHPEVNNDGFLNTIASWNRSTAEELAKEHDIGPLTEDHWRVIDFVQDYYSNYGRGPEVFKIHKRTGLSTSDICTLFPCGMVKGAYRLAGLPRPPGCG
jgi:TusE/DsrC/DsvC family sulfur relay protein